MSVVARLRWAIRNSGLSQAAIERAAPLAPGTLSHILCGRRRLTRAAALIEPVLHVRAAWLLFGERPAWWLVRATDGRCAVNAPGLLSTIATVRPALLRADSKGRLFETLANTRFTLHPRAALRVIRSEATPLNGFGTARIVAVTPKIDASAISATG